MIASRPYSAHCLICPSLKNVLTMLVISVLSKKYLGMFGDNHYDAPVLVWKNILMAFRRFIKEYHTLIGPVELIFRHLVMMMREVEHFWRLNGFLFHLMLMIGKKFWYTEQWILYLGLEGQLEYLAGTPSMICPVRS